MTPQLAISDEGTELDYEPDDRSVYTVNGETDPDWRDCPPSWFPEAWRQLEAIAGLPDGWDSHGAPAPDREKVAAAARLLVCLGEGADLPKPHINPTRSGGVQFEWEIGDRYFELEVMSQDEAAYLFCDDAAHVEETGSLFGNQSLDAVLDYLQKTVATQ